MYTLTGDEVTRQPQRLIDSARRGEATVVSVAGEPVLLAWPLGKGFVSVTSLVDFALGRWELAVLRGFGHGFGAPKPRSRMGKGLLDGAPSWCRLATES